MYVRFASEHSIDENGMQVFSYDEIDPNTALLPPEEYFNYAKQIFLDEDNTVKVSINVKN